MIFSHGMIAYSEGENAFHFYFRLNDDISNINADGELIGLNFDRVWEGTMSDIVFDPEVCRNISLDIRYALFVIREIGHAGHLIEEMDLR